MIEDAPTQNQENVTSSLQRQQGRTKISTLYHRSTMSMSSPPGRSSSVTASSSCSSSSPIHNHDHCDPGGVSTAANTHQTKQSSRSYGGEISLSSERHQRALTSPSSTFSSSFSITSNTSSTVSRRLSDTDVRSIFECLHGQGPLPPPHKNLKFCIVPVGPEGQKLSPPPLEFKGTCHFHSLQSAIS